MPFLKTSVWSLRSRISSNDRSNTLSRTAVSGNIPRRLSLDKSCFSRTSRCLVVMPRSDLAIPRYLESIVLWRQSSCLLRSPYCPNSLSSAWRVSVRQGKRGVSYFFRCFLGSPITLYLCPLLFSAVAAAFS